MKTHSKQVQCFPTLLAFLIGRALGNPPRALVQVTLPDGRVFSDTVVIS